MNKKVAIVYEIMTMCGFMVTAKAIIHYLIFM